MRTWIKRGKPMVGYLNLRQWLLLPLISIIFALSIGIDPAGATLLKDVRIGEYDNFTRVVFEFDSPIHTRRITALEAGRLKVAFAESTPALIRKIPVERSHRIRQFHLWISKTELSAVLTFNFNHFRFESFQLSNPPRIALDVYRLAESERMAPASASAKGDTGSAKDDQADALWQATGTQPLFDSKHPQPEGNSDPETIPPAASTPPTALPQAIATPPRALDPDLPKQQPPAKQHGDIVHTQASNETGAESHNGPVSNALQYYLVVALVGITIIILILLLMMLFTRQRWAENNKPIKVDEFLQRQDERIASLNARIHEQLKRYDDA